MHRVSPLIRKHRPSRWEMSARASRAMTRIGEIEPRWAGRNGRPFHPSSELGLQFRLVRGNEGANFVGHIEQLEPLLLVERNRKAPETVHRDATFLAHLERDAFRCALLQRFVLGL